jgi:ABC-type polysaccharide/polyol phosphate transport system ATPase subunit
MNGAGKSTLLKILSGILRPSDGKIEIAGQLAAILELGVGFHPELSGRDNILMYGKILGFTKKQIDSCFDEIVEFSEISAFINEPIKHYSSGMLMRLGFAVIAFLETDIILLDEMLSVGDINFKNKCINKIIDLKNTNKTIVIVSHDISDISNYCDRLILMHEGQLLDAGPNTSIISQYQQLLLQERASGSATKKNKFRNNNMGLLYKEHLNKLKTSVSFENSNVKAESESFRIISASICSADNTITDEDGFPIDKEIIITFQVEYLGGKGDMVFGIRDFMNNKMFNEYIIRKNNIHLTEKGIYQFSWVLPANLLNEGVFILGFSFVNDALHKIFTINELLTFRTSDTEKFTNDLTFFTPFKPKTVFTFEKIS